jgi:hypothetical protein
LRLRGTLTARWAVDGQPVVVGPDTRVEENPSPGDRVEIRGSVRPDGTIGATRIRRR